jgi:hypothetical protein
MDKHLLRQAVQGRGSSTATPESKFCVTILESGSLINRLCHHLLVTLRIGLAEGATPSPFG